MKKLRLTVPQERHIETALKLVDKAVQRVEFLFEHAVHHPGPAGVISHLDQGTVETLQEMFRRLQATAHEMHQRYGFHSRKLDLERVLDAELSSLWEMLENCRPQRMRGYGPMDEESARRLEADMSILLDLVERARALLLASERNRL